MCLLTLENYNYFSTSVSIIDTPTFLFQIHKSTAGHVFDLSISKEHSSFTEYNSLHDTHLRAYYYRPTMKKKLISNGFVTENLKVICSLREYSAYHNFLEMEFMKLRRRQEEEKEWERRVGFHVQGCEVV